jgi:hypothetical protein
VKGSILVSARSKRLIRVDLYDAYTVAQLEAAFEGACADTQHRICYGATHRAYQRLLSGQGRPVTVAASLAHNELRQRYRQELLELRGLGLETVQQHERTIGEFLSNLLSEGWTLKSRVPTDIDGYLSMKRQTVGLPPLQHIVSQLRAFLAFCRTNGKVRASVEVIDPVMPMMMSCRQKPYPGHTFAVCCRLSIARADRSGETMLSYI